MTPSPSLRVSEASALLVVCRGVRGDNCKVSFSIQSHFPPGMRITAVLLSNVVFRTDGVRALHSDYFIRRVRQSFATRTCVACPILCIVDSSVSHSLWRAAAVDRKPHKKSALNGNVHIVASVRVCCALSLCFPFDGDSLITNMRIALARGIQCISPP